MKEQKVDPPKHERKYYRHVETGDRGYLIFVDGDIVMKYDRGPQAPWTEWKKEKWVEDEQILPMSEMQVAEIAYLTVGRYNYYAGNHAKARRKWESLREEERIHWMKKGPDDPQARKWYDAVMACGKEFHR